MSHEIDRTMADARARGVILPPTFHQRVDEARAAAEGRADGFRPLVGLWNSSGSSVAGEILASSGADFLIIDGEHGPMELDGILRVLQATAAYPATPLVRVPWNDTVRIKQVLDIGAQNLIIPKVGTGEQARAAVDAARYPGEKGGRYGARGIGAALARSSRWGQVPEYVHQADQHVNVIVQIESSAGVENARDIAGTDGVSGIFIGPADLAGSMGYPNNPGAPEVVAAVEQVIGIAQEAGVPVGINAFAPAVADRWRDHDVDFVVVSADVTLMVQGAIAAVDRHRRWSKGHPGEPLEHAPGSPDTPAAY